MLDYNNIYEVMTLIESSLKPADILQAKMEKPRNYLFDNLKAIMIFVVVSTHFLRATEGFTMATIGGATYLAMISVDMIIFIFASGYFSKNVQKSRRTAFKTFLFPYIMLSIVMYGVRFLIYGNATFNIFLPSLALWFMMVLFFYRFFLKDLVKLGKYLLPFSFAVSILAGFVPQFNSTLALGRTFGFLPFFILGYLATAEHIAKIRKIPKYITAPIFVGLIAYSFVMAYEKVLPMSTWFFKSSYMSVGFEPIEGALTRAGLLIIALVWMVTFINLVPDRKTWYTGVGLQTMAVYGLHLTLRHLMVVAHTDFGGGAWSWIVPLALAFLTTWLLSRAPIANAFNFVMDWTYMMLAYPARKLAAKINSN